MCDMGRSCTTLKSCCTLKSAAYLLSDEIDRYKMQARKIIPDPNNNKMVFYSPTGDFRSVREQNGQRKDNTRIYDESTPETFANAQDIPFLNDIGHTRPKGTLHGYDDGWYSKLEYDAGFIAAPQNFKSGKLLALDGSDPLITPLQRSTIPSFQSIHLNNRLCTWLTPSCRSHRVLARSVVMRLRM